MRENVSNTYKGNKHHPTVCNQIKKCLDLAVFFKLSANLVAVSLILETYTTARVSPSSSLRTPLQMLCAPFNVTLALMLRINSVRQGRSRCIRSSIMDSCTLSSL